jgi:hypothetical protein
MWEGEARDLLSSYRHHLRTKGPEYAKQFIVKALAVMCRRYRVSDDHVRSLMREMDSEQRYIEQWNEDLKARVLQQEATSE